MKLILTGTGTPWPLIDRCGPGQLIEVGHDLLQFDCGDGTTSQLLRAGRPPERVRDLFLTHLHTDHINGLMQFAIGGWIRGRDRLAIYGPSGSPALIQGLFRGLLAYDLEQRYAVGMPKQGMDDVDVQVVQEGLVLERPGYRVTAAAAEHGMEAYAYRVEAGGKAIVVTGDTTYCERVVRLARGADILVHESNRTEHGPRTEAYRPVWQAMAHIHSTPEMAGRAAREAGVRHLVLMHLKPEVIPEEIAARAAAEFDGRITVASDLLELAC